MTARIPRDGRRGGRDHARLRGGRRGRRLALAWAGRLIVLGLVFWIGLAVGRAVEEAPQPGGTQTLVRTLEPRTVPAAVRTVTVTVSAP